MAAINGVGGLGAATNANAPTNAPAADAQGGSAAVLQKMAEGYQNNIMQTSQMNMINEDYHTQAGALMLQDKTIATQKQREIDGCMDILNKIGQTKA